MLKAYLAGPITGLPENNIAEFRQWESKLKLLGYKVIVPHDLFKGMDTEDFHHSDYMKVCLRELLTCDLIISLNGWHQSKGADMEVRLARQIQIPDVLCHNAKPAQEVLLRFKRLNHR